MMTFEEWWWPRKPLGDDLISGDVVTVAARAAWGARDAEIDELKKANSKLAEAAIVPEGYVLVPVEPTDAMISFGVTGYLDPEAPTAEDHVKHIYTLMIQSAQESE